MVKTLNDMNKTSERIFKSGNSKAISLGIRSDVLFISFNVLTIYLISLITLV
jgi:hypothetical protein